MEAGRFCSTICRTKEKFHFLFTFFFYKPVFFFKTTTKASSWKIKKRKYRLIRPTLTGLVLWILNDDAVVGAKPVHEQSSPLHVSYPVFFWGGGTVSAKSVNPSQFRFFPAHYQSRARHLWSDGVHSTRRSLRLAKVTVIMLLSFYLKGERLGWEGQTITQREKKKNPQTNYNMLACAHVNIKGSCQ